ncbi:hypothetical protein IG631_10649 [Alternaria alternata]|nr:hypothetical protein IG631_10649 [Alternaria alternata]
MAGYNTGKLIRKALTRLQSCIACLPEYLGDEGVVAEVFPHRYSTQPFLPGLFHQDAQADSVIRRCNQPFPTLLTMARERGVTARDDGRRMDRREKGRVDIGKCHCKISGNSSWIVLDADMIA